MSCMAAVLVQIDDQGLVNTDPRYIAVPQYYPNMIPTDVRGLTFSRTPQQVHALAGSPSSPKLKSRLPQQIAPARYSREHPAMSAEWLDVDSRRPASNPSSKPHMS